MHLFSRILRNSISAAKVKPSNRLAWAGLMLLVGLVSAEGARATSEDFPLRNKYPDVETISTADLARALDGVIIVDARSAAEFDVIHMLKAHHVPVAEEATFPAALREIAPHPQRAVVMYCNGAACSKSYDAARRAKVMGYMNVRAYDAGIMEWARSHPDKTMLFGESPLDPSQLLSSEDLAAHTLPAEEFIRGATGPDAMVIDLRENSQRKRVKVLPGIKSIHLPSDRFSHYIGLRQFRQSADQKTIYVFDAVGRQVRWIQYYLEGNGYRDYFFLNGGVRSIDLPAKARP